MQEKLYSIGETAKIMGISVQTLRNYSNSDLRTPAYINKETGYRYFSFRQFHIIDRIKYLRSFGLSLSDIAVIMRESDDTDEIVHFLREQKDKISREIDDLVKNLEDIQWYIDYFRHIDEHKISLDQHIQYFGQRTILTEKIREGETIEEIEVSLAEKRTRFSDVHYHRQFGYLLSYENLLKKNWKPYRYFIYLSETDDDTGVLEKVKSKKEANACEDFLNLPKGYYLCFSFRLHHMDELNLNEIEKHLRNVSKPSFVIANEYEDNLKTYSSCPYEIQIPIEKMKKCKGVHIA